MKDNVDIISATVGAIGALLKGLKMKLNFKSLIISVCIGAFLGFGTIGLLEYFMDEVSRQMIILVSFSTGWVANELTESMEKLVDVFYSFIADKFKNKEDETNE